MKNLQLDYSDMKRIIFEAILIICLGISAGLSFNHELIMDVFEGRVVESQAVGLEAEDQLPVPISLDDVEQKRSSALLVDARITELYDEGHLPGAVSLPFAAVDTQLAPFLAAHPVNRSLIIYCSGYGCSDSFDLGVKLIAAGYNDVMVYEGGYPEWRDAGLPLEGGAQ